MGALPAARTALQAVVRNPILLVAALLLAVGSGAVAATSQIPIVGVFLSLLLGIVFFFVEPFLSGGLLGMSHEALEDDTSFETFTRTGKRVYLRLLAARLAEWALSLVYFGVTALLVIVLLVVFLGVGSSISDNPEGAIGAGLLGVALIGGVFLALLIVYYLLGFLVQFHPAAIVVEDATLIDSLQRSFDLVTANPGSAIGYSLLVAIVSGTIGAIPFGYVTVTGGVIDIIAQENPEALLGLGVVNAVIYFGIFVVVQTLLIPLLRTYHVAFYVETAEFSDGEAGLH